MTMSAEELAEFRAREEGMWIAETRGDPEWLNQHFAPQFTEHGRSGRTYDRATIMAEPVPDMIECVLPLPDFAVRVVAPTVALVTYTSIVSGQASNRVSVWSLDGDQWRMEFHQGTATHTPTEDNPELVALAEGIRNVAFGEKRRGYDKIQVNGFVQALADQIEAGRSVDPSTVSTAEFDVVPNGYNRKQVNGFLQGVRIRLGGDDRPRNRIPF